MKLTTLLLLASTALAIPQGKGLGKGMGKGPKGAKGASPPPAGDELPAAQAPSAGGGPPSGSRITLIFARGTTETGTMGITVGPALERAMRAKFGGSFRAQGVPYPADMGGAVSGAMNPKGAKGAIKMAEMAKTALQGGSKVVLSGYSQGAEQVHGALLNLGAEGARISAAVTFGDPLAKFPMWGSMPAARAKIFCNSGDGVCNAAFSISAAHLSYTTNGNIGQAVSFIQSVIRG